jgi:hypothetical protein
MATGTDPGALRGAGSQLASNLVARFDAFLAERQLTLDAVVVAGAALGCSA